MGCAIGIDLGGTKISSGLVDQRGKLTLTQFAKTPQGSNNSSRVIKEIQRQVTLIMQERGSKTISRLGVGVAGQLSIDKRSVTNSPNIDGLTNFPLARKLEESMGVKVTLENDAKCFTIAESAIGCAKEYSRVLGVTLGTGVGGGLYSDGLMQDGAHLCAGEIGHMILIYGGAKCHCGSRGCMEQYASGTALTRLWRQETGKSIDAKTLARMAFEKNGNARNVFGVMGSYLGAGLAGAANLFDPKAIVLGGSVSQSFDLFRKSMRKEFEKAALPPLRKIPILKSTLRQPGVVGAALSAMN